MNLKYESTLEQRAVLAIMQQYNVDEYKAYRMLKQQDRWLKTGKNKPSWLK